MTPTFLKHFDPITDPRIERCKKHDLLDILLLAICAVISGAEGWEDIEDFGHLKLNWLRRYRPFKAGIPKHDTIARVICRLKAQEIEHAFQSWISSLVETTGCDVIALTVKQQGVRLPQKIEKMHYIQSVHGVANINWY